MAANSERTAKKPRGRPFAPGQSGNPNGRPKTSPEQKSALEAIRDLAPKAAEIMQQMLESADTPAAVKVRIVTEVLDRTYGKALLPVALDDAKADTLTEIRAEVERIRAQVVGSD